MVHTTKIPIGNWLSTEQTLGRSTYPPTIMTITCNSAGAVFFPPLLVLIRKKHNTDRVGWLNVYHTQDRCILFTYYIHNTYKNRISACETIYIHGSQAGIRNALNGNYTKCSIRSARSPGSISITGISIIV